MTKRDFVLAVLAASDGADHTPVQIQKLFFLLDRRLGDSAGGRWFHFIAWDYGPFDPSVYQELNALAEDGLVEKTVVADRRNKTYRTTPIGLQQGRELLGQLGPRVQEYIKRLSAWVRSLSFAELVSYIYKEFPDMKERSVFRAY